MDRYKFRGKVDIEVTNEIEEHVKDGWVYGNLIGRSLIVGDVIDLDDDYFNTEFWISVKPETVGQYTGLQCNVTDEEWYERDILTPDPHSKRTENEVICYDSHQGKYKSVPISLYLANAGNGGWTGFEIKGYQKRIGNVIDNPELLEG